MRVYGRGETCPDSPSRTEQPPLHVLLLSDPLAAGELLSGIEAFISPSRRPKLAADEKTILSGRVTEKEG